MLEELSRARTRGVVNVERLGQKVARFRRNVGRDRRFRRLTDLCGNKRERDARQGMERYPYFKDGLHLGQLGPWMFAREHFDDETSNAPNVRCARVSLLLYHLGRHPKYRTLQRRSVHALSREEI